MTPEEHRGSFPKRYECKAKEVLPGRLWVAIKGLKQGRSDFYWIDLKSSFSL